MTVRPRPKRAGAYFPSLAAGFFASLGLLLGGAAGVDAQLSSQRQVARAPLVYLDCQGGGIPCNQNYFRTEITWVNWVNDPVVSDVQVILTGENVGGGGRRFNFDFLGRGGMAHLSDKLTYTSQGTDVQVETLEGITQALRLGLLRYAVEAGMGRDFGFDVRQGTQVAVLGDGDAAAPPSLPTQPYDPWNYWTFRVGLSGNASIQELRSNTRLNPSFQGDRVTDSWKMNFNSNANFNRQKIKFPNSDRVVRNDNDSWNFSTLIVRSITGHSSTGLDIRSGSSTQNNRKMRFSANPAVEWNLFPYSESNRRQLIAHYGAGVQYNKYQEETVFGVMDETVPLHRLGVQYRTVQGWGNAGVNLSASQYLHRSGLYSFGADGNISFRVSRGLELSLSASGEKIADQIHIRATALSEEDILLGRISLPTGYQYQGSLGFNYRWGSSFSNIVNTRFPNSVRN